MNRSNRFVIGLVLTGGVFLAIGGFKAWNTWQGLGDSQRVEGKVVDLASSHGTRSTLYSPVFQYEVDGTIYRVRGKSASSSPGYKVGEKVTVVFPRSNPGDGVIDSFTEVWLPPIAFAGCGVMFMLVGLNIRWWQRRLNRGLSPRQLHQS